MTSSFRALCKSIFHLGSGELLGRLCNVAILVFLGHRYGVLILGMYALAQSLTQYLPPLIDFGLRHVGARLMAMYPQAAGVIVDQVQRRRRRMAVLVLPLLLVYSACARLPLDMRIFLFAFSATGVLYAISLDWAAWGQGKLYLVGIARSAVPLSILLFLAVGRPSEEKVLWWAVVGNAFGYLLQGAILWAWWRRQPSLPGYGGIPDGEILDGEIPDARTLDSNTGDAIRESLAWRRTRIMGMAWLCNMAFNTIDLLMLGVMSNAEQVGLYGAAYRILNQLLVTYYLLTQVLYPRFARQRIEERAGMLRARILIPLAAAGILVASVLSVSRHLVLTIEFGHQFLAASPLLLLLAWSIPLDFVTSYLSNAYIAWGMEKKILACTGIAAASNIILNLAFIPRYGARGAAINTLLSYAVFLAALGFAGKTARELSSASTVQETVVACH
jgi:O-antigen/teichoic acid export membrane protein